MFPEPPWMGWGGLGERTAPLHQTELAVSCADALVLLMLVTFRAL